jgi:hypothetical protein
MHGQRNIKKIYEQVFYDKIAGYYCVKKPNLSLSFFVFQVSTFVPYVMQLKSEMQARFTSVERILEYTEV